MVQFNEIGKVLLTSTAMIGLCAAGAYAQFDDAVYGKDTLGPVRNKSKDVQKNYDQSCPENAKMGEGKSNTFTWVTRELDGKNDPKKKGKFWDNQCVDFVNGCEPKNECWTCNMEAPDNHEPALNESNCTSEKVTGSCTKLTTPECSKSAGNNTIRWDVSFA